jgi:hypothetical protein
MVRGGSRLILPMALASLLGLFVGRAQASPETDFWKWFERNESALFDFERDQEKTLASAMQKVHPQLAFEFGPKQGSRREFVISADGRRDAFPAVESLFRSAPKLPKWQFIKFRPRREPMDIGYGGVTVRADAVTVAIERDGSKAGITVFVPGYTKAAHETYMGVAFLFLDQALGEFDVETRVGFIEVLAPMPKSDARPLRELPQAFDALLAK